MPWHACLFLPQVADIHRASKDGQLYDIGGGDKSCTAQAEPPEPTEYDIRPASQVYSVSTVLASTPNLGSGKAPLPFALSQAQYLTFAWHYRPGPRVPRGRP